MEKINELTSENIVQQNIERLKEIFPTAFSEGKLVVDELQALLGDYIEKDKEFYQMTWAGKTQAQKEANKVSTGTLRPNKADSKNWDTTGNIFIEGDNLEVLKLLQKTYSNKIKMIYIDPPYNTGKDFVYKDNYKDNLHNYLEITGQTDAEGKKRSTNTDSDGRYHSNWLNMMYPRLKLARNLMTDDGVIFISIDDNEQPNLKKLCDEIFGEEFVECYIWDSREKGKLPKTPKNTVRKEHEYLICCFKRSPKLFPYTSQKYLNAKGWSNVDNDSRGNWMSANISRGSDIPQKEGKNTYTITNPKGGSFYRDWSIEKDEFDKLLKDDRIYFADNGNGVPRKKIFQTDFIESIQSSIFEELRSSQSAAVDLNKLLNGNVFDFPKTIDLIKRIISIASNKSDFYILDFFAGSGTTAHAVMALNADDGGNRKCISVQLPEPTDEKSEAFKAGYKTIAEITKERIRRAGELVKQEYKDKENIEKLDIGFRAFTLDSSNIQAWDTSIDKFEDQLNMFEENNGDSIKSNRTEEDVLFEILLKYGLDLTLPIQEKQIDGCTVYNIGFGSMYICLSNQIKVSVAKGISEWHKDSADKNPSVIFKDAGFGGDDSIKTNTVQTLRQAGIENVKSI